MNAIAPGGASAHAPVPRRRSSEISVSVDVSIDEFDDDVILEAADDIRGSRAESLVSDHHDLALSAHDAIIRGDHAEERRLARELIGEIIGRIL